MRIWLVQTGEPIPIKKGVRKMRTALLADVLVARGHDIVWWTSAFDHVSKKFISDKDAEFNISPRYVIKTLFGVPYKRHISINRYRNYHTIASKFSKIAADEPRPDIIIASMPDYFTAQQAINFGKSKNIPVIIDIRDLWPDFFINRIPTGFLKRLFKLILFREYKRLHFVVSSADALFAITDHFLKWGLKHAQQDQTWKDKVFYLGAPKILKVEKQELSESFKGILKSAENKFVITFIGFFHHYSDPLVIIEAARIINESNSNNEFEFEFVLGGHGSSFQAVKKSAIGLTNVKMAGWLTTEEISALLNISSVGVIPSASPVAFFPNKAFSYMSAGIPILSCVSGELENLMREKKIGLNFLPQDGQELARLILKLREDKKNYEEMRNNSKRLFQERFNAANIYNSYAEHVEAIAAH